MKDFDYGYFGTGDEGYAQYKTAFDRNFGTDDSDQDDFSTDDVGDSTDEDDF